MVLTPAAVTEDVCEVKKVGEGPLGSQNTRPQDEVGIPHTRGSQSPTVKMRSNASCAGRGKWLNSSSATTPTTTPWMDLTSMSCCIRCASCAINLARKLMVFLPKVCNEAMSSTNVVGVGEEEEEEEEGTTKLCCPIASSG